MSPESVPTGSFSTGTTLTIPKLADDGSNWVDFEAKARNALGSKGLIRYLDVGMPKFGSEPGFEPRTAEPNLRFTLGSVRFGERSPGSVRSSPLEGLGLNRFGLGRTGEPHGQI